MWLPLLAYFVIMLALLWLGNWQLERRDARIAELETFERQRDAVIDVDTVESLTRDAFKQVVARGRYVGDRQFLIDNIVRGGRNGFLVVTPLALIDRDELLLVNRGWVPQTPDRRPLADLTVGDDNRSVSGRIGRLPVGGLKLSGSVPAEVRWPSIRQYPDLDELSAALGTPLLPWVLLLSPDEAAGFEREWRPGGLPPERHLGYAVQWFALAAALTAIAALMILRRKKP